VSSRGLLRLVGPQRIWFLQQTITADVEDLPDGAWRESAFLTPKGKIVSHFAVGVLGDEVYLDIDPPADALTEWLTRYRFRTKVEIEDLSSVCTSAIGPAAAELAGEGEIRRVEDAIVFGYRYGETALAHIHGALEFPPASEEEVERIRIEAGVPRFGVDYTTDNLPQEAGLTRIVPVDKGCYVGQETVARIHFRGHVNKVVRPLRLVDAPAALGAGLSIDGQKTGVITSVAGEAAIAMSRVEPPEGATAEVSTGGTAVLGPVPEGTKVKPG
jgi:folate-binding protein YgfZ